jgi:hypothetical protein
MNKETFNKLPKVLGISALIGLGLTLLKVSPSIAAQARTLQPVRTEITIAQTTDPDAVYTGNGPASRATDYIINSVAEIIEGLTGTEIRNTDGINTPEPQPARPETAEEREYRLQMEEADRQRQINNGQPTKSQIMPTKGKIGLISYKLQPLK